MGGRDARLAADVDSERRAVPAERLRMDVIKHGEVADVI